MKKYPAYLLCVLLVLSSCGTNTHAEQGAATGAMFGSIFGSALGGILGGPRGSDIGTLTGMVGGAVLGASVGSAVDASEQRDRYPRGGYDRPQRRSANERTRDYDHPTRDYDNDAQGYDDGSGFDPTNSGDDRITFDSSPSDGYPASGSDVYTTVQPRTVSLEQLSRTLPEANGVRFNRLIEIRNASFVDADGDGMICRGEQCKVSFDIMNRSSEALLDINPVVAETTGNSHIRISAPVKIERIAPGHGMRYTASVYGDSRLKDGEIVLKVCVVQGGSEIGSQVEEFHIATKKK